MSKIDYERLVEWLDRSAAQSEAIGLTEQQMMYTQAKEAVQGLIRLRGNMAGTADGAKVGMLDAVYGPVTGRRYIVIDSATAQQDRNFGEDDGHRDNAQKSRIGEEMFIPIYMCYSSFEAFKNAENRP